jgi:1-deoxy-D-xylulose-5-phosphate reductoisomerase
MSKKIALIGSTGSIGTQTLEVARERGYRITALAARRSVDLLEAQIREFSPALVAVSDERAARELKVRVADTPVKVLSGDAGVEALAFEADADVLLNSMLGRCGTRPTLAAIDSGKDIAMANKEPLVASGELLLARAREKGVRFLPVDSEHSAIFQCLDSSHNSPEFIRRLIITASGGPFFGKTREELRSVTVEQALAHPTWSMGAKISVDSATLMNKGLELIEAVRLFGVGADRIDVTVHRQSIVHSMVEFCDRSTLAQMGHPDMREAIQFAFSFPERLPLDNKKLDFAKLGKMSFFEADTDRFPALTLAYEALAKGGNVPCAMNAANEAAVAAFLEGRIGFYDITTIVEECMQTVEFASSPDIDNIFQTNEETLAKAGELITKISR